MARRINLGAGVLWLCVPLTPLLFRKNILSLLSISVLGLFLGTWRGSIYMQRLVPYSVLAQRKITIIATASSDAVYGQKSQLAFDVTAIQLQAPRSQNLVGTIGVAGFGAPMIYRGDRVEVTGKLYPNRGARQGKMSFAQIRRIEPGKSAVDLLRRKFAASLQSSLPEPLGSLALGILIGQRSTLPDSLTADLSRSGLTHIVAVSGYNLTILVQLAHRALRKRSKYQATVLTLGMILGFLLLTGSSASIVRAAVVSTLSLWAAYYGRSIRPSLLILLAAAMTAGWFPPYLWGDLGWHLSFLAFIGILLLAPLLQWRLWPNKPPGLLGQLLIETSCAQLMTLPLIMFTFGQLSIVALAANILVVPLVPIAMALSFIAGAGGLLLPALAGWFAWPARILLTYQVDIISLCARLPHAAIAVSLHVWQMVLTYLIGLGVATVWWRKTAKNATITDRTIKSERA